MGKTLPIHFSEGTCHQHSWCLLLAPWVMSMNTLVEGGEWDYINPF
ncbi:hypothetical protein J5A71_04370 [Prevotella melaninogenica]|nr:MULTISPECIES: hypothetical protein [Prevotella]MBF1596784.1 hypothetical protein [Prevotella sp.]QUB56559.1 hypothetical protein J5A72_02755 [Prevotella melaninogenica]QUB57885.1 hypothetical protein J5A71_04370 [Prevotella melaninogenica]